MFKSYQFIDYNPNNKQYTYKITDDSFEETMETSYGSVVDVIIKIYNKRDLPVAPNIIRAMLLIKNSHGWELYRQYLVYKTYLPQWTEVDKDIKKYLLFS